LFPSPGGSAADPLEPTVATIDFQGAITGYLVYLAHIGKARHTLAATRGDLEQLASSLGRGALEDVSTADLRLYVERLAEVRSNRTASLRRKIASVKAFFRYLVQEQLLTGDPSAAIPYPAAPEREIEPLDDSSVERLLETAATTAHRVLLLCMVDAGIKRDELLALQGRDLILDEEGSSRIAIQRGLTSSRVRTREIPVTARLAAALAHHIRELNPECVLFPLSTRGVDYIVRESGAHAGLSQSPALTPQRLRDTFAVRWLRNRLRLELAESDSDARRQLEATHDRELAELLGLVPETLSVERYRRAAHRELDRAETAVLANH
jgi:integrase/recombinase XerD